MFGERTHNRDRKVISWMTRMKHPKHQLVKLNLEHVDWSRSIREVSDGERATIAEVVVKNEAEQRTLEFQKILFVWFLKCDAPDYGPNVPDGEYYFTSDGFGHAGLMKTEGGHIIRFNRKTLAWELYDMKYSDFYHYSSHKRVTKEEADRIIKEYEKSRQQ